MMNNLLFLHRPRKKSAMILFVLKRKTTKTRPGRALEVLAR
jgi:hypothetical protein